MKRVAESFRKEFAIVADDGFPHDLDADAIQLFGQEKRIGIQPVRGQKLRANGDDFSFHF